MLTSASDSMRFSLETRARDPRETQTRLKTSSLRNSSTGSASCSMQYSYGNTARERKRRTRDPRNEWMAASVITREKNNEKFSLNPHSANLPIWLSFFSVTRAILISAGFQIPAIRSNRFVNSSCLIQRNENARFLRLPSVESCFDL